MSLTIGHPFFWTHSPYPIQAGLFKTVLDSINNQNLRYSGLSVSGGKPRSVGMSPENLN